MNKTDIEKEIDARVSFKFNEYKTALENRLKLKYASAFDMTHKSDQIYRAFLEVCEIIDKEVAMPIPSYDNMIEYSKREAKNLAIDELLDLIEKRLGYRGSDLNLIVQKLVSIVEKAQNY